MQILATAATTTLADHYDGPGNWWPLIPLFWFGAFILFFFVLARFGRFGRRHCYPSAGWPGDGTSAGKARLAERFAAGEIDETEYRSRLDVLDQLSSHADDVSKGRR